MNAHRFLGALYGLALVVAFVSCLLRPVSFQKANAIRDVSVAPPFLSDNSANARLAST